MKKCVEKCCKKTVKKTGKFSGKIAVEKLENSGKIGETVEENNMKIACS